MSRTSPAFQEKTFVSCLNASRIFSNSAGLKGVPSRKRVENSNANENKQLTSLIIAQNAVYAANFAPFLILRAYFATGRFIGYPESRMGLADRPISRLRGDRH